MLCISYALQGFTETSVQKQADLVIFSFDRPLQLHALLSSLKTYAQNLATIYVVYRSSSRQYQKAFDEIHALFPQTIFVSQDNDTTNDFKNLLFKYINESTTPYILFAHDDAIVKDYVNLNHCIQALEKNNAFGFYLSLGSNITHDNHALSLKIPSFQEVGKDIYAFTFLDEKSYWGYPNTLDLALYRKADIIEQFNQFSYHSPDTLEGQWARKADKSKIGLCYKSSKALNIPLNLVQQDWNSRNEAIFTPQELLDTWNKGLMMNTQSYHQIINNSCHMAYAPAFIPLPRNDIPEKKITVIIPSYNNAQYFEQNLSSVFMQDYSNYHIIYIDDASPDHTGTLVEQFIRTNHLENKITLIKNSYNRRALANMYKAIHMCHPEDLIVELDGDDALAHNQIFKQINAHFSTYDIWFAYAQYKNLPEKKAIESKLSLIGFARPVSTDQLTKRNYRGTWIWSGLRIFYAWIAQRVRLEEMLLPKAPYIGKFFPTSKDNALIYPILEMCGNRFTFIPEILLLRNVDTPINDFKIARDLQIHCLSFLKTIAPYDILKRPEMELSIHDVQIPSKLASINFLIEASSPKNLKNYLDSTQRYINISENHFVLIPEEFQKKYAKVKNEYPLIKWLIYNKKTLPDLDKLINSVNYTILTHDKLTMNYAIPFKDCINHLEKTFAHAFFYSIDLSSFGDPSKKGQLPCEQIINDIYAWKFECMPSIISTNNNSMILLRSQDLKKLFEKIKKIPSSLVSYIEKEIINMQKKIGLFFEKRKTT